MSQSNGVPHGKRKSGLSGQASVAVLWKLALGAVALLLIWWLAISSPRNSSNGAESAAPADALPSAPAATPRAQTSAATAAEQQPGAPGPPSAAPSAPAPQPSAAPSAPVPQKQGPVEELSQTFAGESRGPTSEQDETRVRAAFVDPAIPTTLLRTVECRRSVCRAQLHWSPQHDPAYVLGLTRAVGSFSAPLGVDTPGDADAEGQRPLTVYFGLAR